MFLTEKRGIRLGEPKFLYPLHSRPVMASLTLQFAELGLAKVPICKWSDQSKGLKMDGPGCHWIGLREIS